MRSMPTRSWFFFFTSLAGMALLAGANLAAQDVQDSGGLLTLRPAPVELDLTRMRPVLYDPETNGLYDVEGYQWVPVDLAVKGDTLRVLVLAVP